MHVAIIEAMRCDGPHLDTLRRSAQETGASIHVNRLLDRAPEEMKMISFNDQVRSHFPGA